jgi:hypothetical protein
MDQRTLDFIGFNAEDPSFHSGITLASPDNEDIRFSASKSVNGRARYRRLSCRTIFTWTMSGFTKKSLPNRARCSRHATQRGRIPYFESVSESDNAPVSNP